MHIAIDKTQNKITGVVSGRYYFDIIPFYDGMQKIFKESNVNPPFHWSKISRKVKAKSGKKIVKLINESNLKLNCFYHEKPPSVSRKEYFHSLLPRKIAENLEPWLKNKDGNLTIDVDRDYDLDKYNKTENFIQSFITQLGFRLVGKYIKIRKGDSGSFVAELKQDNGGHLNIFGGVRQANQSKGIQIIDVVMGIIKEYEKDIKKERLHFRKI